ncbi:MAG TPA: hypothetical protein VJ910_03845 [Desulfuromonadales bacterium]|nr:hypothetical protein [Desulfuromonadales bacterium]
MTPVRTLLACLAVIFCLAFPQLAVAAPAQAYLRADEHGQALLMSRLGECYAVTPEHVIGGALFATLVGGTPDAPQGDADLLQTFGYDLSILRATGAVTRRCGGSLTNVPALDNVLAAASAGVISSVNSDGSITRRDVTFTDVGLVHLRIRPRGTQDQLFKGLSGSLVLAGKEPVGILMAVDPETGEGRALRYDRAMETLRPFFGLAADPDGSPPKSLETTPAGGASAPSGEVVSWSSPSLGHDYRAANLVDGAEKNTIWLAQVDTFPIELVIELPGDQTRIVDGVRLVGTGVEPGTRLPRDFEILINNKSEGGWVPVSSGTYFQSDTDKRVNFMPVRARRLMLRIYSHWGDGEAVGLAEFEVLIQQQ